MTLYYGNISSYSDLRYFCSDPANFNCDYYKLYKTGMQTGTTYGKVYSYNIALHPYVRVFTTANGTVAISARWIIVENLNNTNFTQSGDSGETVYVLASFGVIVVGTVTGGTNEYTYVFPVYDLPDYIKPLTSNDIHG